MDFSANETYSIQAPPDYSESDGVIDSSSILRVAIPMLCSAYQRSAFATRCLTLLRGFFATLCLSLLFHRCSWTDIAVYRLAVPLQFHASQNSAIAVRPDP